MTGRFPVNTGMERPVNIYPAVMFDLHPRIKAYIDELDQSGQIDHDEHRSPYVTGIEDVGVNRRIFLIRNGRSENFVLNTRRKAPPHISWNAQDGYRRKSPVTQPVVPPAAAKNGRRPERAKRTNESASVFEAIVESIFEDIDL